MKIITRIIAVIVVLLCANTSQAQTPSEINSYISRLTSTYTDWNSCELSGKLYMDGLPLNPSVKIYMEKGRKLMLSIRASILGEVGRIEISDGNILAVNKLKKVYVWEKVSNLMGGLPITVSDIQDALLGRAFLIGEGTLSMNNYALATIECYDSDNWIIVPLSRPQGLHADYGFSADGNARLRMLFAVYGNDLTGSLEYAYQGKKTDITFTFTEGTKGMDARLSLDAPKWNATAMGSFKPDKNYRKVGINEFLKLF